jgi:alpha-L-fucosidase
MPPQAPATPTIPAETKEQKDARMAWWRKARFGMFIHWGLYAIPAGEWNGKTEYGEWIRESAHIPIETYNKFQQQFNPVKFNAKEWAKMAHDAGMQYLVITSKHHDGFNMFDSKYTDFKVTNTPFHRDPIRELSTAVRAEGLKFCLYHSIMDWHHPDYLPRRSWEVADRPEAGADYSRFVQYLRNDVQQILTDYGHLGVIWFDGEWEGTWHEPYGSELYALCRTVDPKVIVNNRVGHARDRALGDYSTPEQTIPPTGLPGVDWETCMTMNGNWGYNSHDHNYKSVKVLIQDLVDIASKGGNLLLNVGPRADGTFPPEAIEHLKGLGAWMKVNHDSIYDTTASVFESLPWGRCTVRVNSKVSKLFLHVFDWPTDGKLVVPGLGNKVKGARVLGGGKVTVDRTGSSLVLSVPSQPIDANDTVVELDVLGTPQVAAH